MLGDTALIALLLAALSGVVLLAFFDPRAPYRSISEWLLANPAATLARNVHYWAAQIVLVAGSLYAWQRLRAAGTAARWAIAVPLVALLMLCGFLLRGDGDAREVLRIVGLLTGAPVSGPGGRGIAVLVLHLAVAAVVLIPAILSLRHRGRPHRLLALAITTLVVGVALFVSPGLHDGLDPTHSGPWYFLPLQLGVAVGVEPLVLGAALVVGIAALLALPWLPSSPAAKLRPLLGTLLVLYLFAGLVAVFARSEEGALRLAWPAARGDLHAGWVLHKGTQAAPVAVLGRAEGCLGCHSGIEGLGDAHAPAKIGCSSCHGGNPFAADAAAAHAGMLRVPGNLADAPQSCGQAGCHLATVPRVQRSIMSTMAGVIAVNRQVLGEPIDPSAPPPHAAELGHSVADHHLRELCIGCHLGQAKRESGPINEESQGGGCNACHLVYSKEALAELDRYRAEAPGSRRAPAVHPTLTVNPGNEHCFGCHSRSSRISTNFEGWNELRGAPPADLPASRLRQLQDGRHFERIVPDIHHERGLACIDCHVSGELMGTGMLVARKSEQVMISCEDCHAARLASVAVQALDAESQRLLAARQWRLPPSARIGTTRGGVPLVNVTVDADGRGSLRRKHSGEALPLKPPAAVCTEGAGHSSLSCISCHSAWAPRCTSCHTEYDPQGEGFDHLTQTWGKGTWNETAGPFVAVPPTLGVRAHRGADGHDRRVIETFVPGMIMTFDRNRDPGRPPDVLFRRLYGLTFAHTIRREARSCASCHADPIALGYGAGTLRYEKSAAGGRWHFKPQQPASKHDGLPEDAWIGFLQPRQGMVSTRDDVRPFSVQEQRRILRVGACLTCHAPDSAVMTSAVGDFEAVLARRSSRCVLPAWPQ